MPLNIAIVSFEHHVERSPRQLLLAIYKQDFLSQENLLNNPSSSTVSFLAQMQDEITYLLECCLIVYGDLLARTV